MKKYLFTLIACMCSMLSWAVVIDGINYELSSNSGVYTAIVISKSDKYSGDIVIPSEVNYEGVTYKVTSIGYDAFYNCSSLTSVTIPESVTSIEKYAFYNCSNLTKVTIPESVTSIGEHAFLSCSSLKDVYYTGTIEEWCDIDFDYGSSNPLYNEASFYVSGKLVTDLVIPEGITEIKKYVFYGCKNITKVTIPKSVTSIGSYAFSGCSSLGKVYYNGLIEDWCGISFDDSYANPLSIAGRLYIGGKEVVKPVIPEGVTEIKPYTFYGWKRLAKLTLSEGLTKIGDYAFYNCVSMTSANIPFTVEEIGSYAFCNCTGWAGELVIPDSVIIIGDYAFCSCSALTAVTLGSGVKTIGYCAFYDCNGLTKVSYNGTIADWCGISFEDVSANPLCYASYLYVDGVKVNDLVVPEGVTEIKEYAFYNCYGLVSITLPSTMEEIGDNVFYSCSSLSKVTCNAEIPPLVYGDSFTDQQYKTLYVPSASIEDYKEAAHWKEFGNFLPSEEEMFLISATAINGSVDGAGAYAKGASIKLEVTANSGYEFKQWSDGNTDNPRTVTVEGNATYNAECGEITYTISATAQNAKVTGTGGYKYGETATLTVIVDNGYNFKQWSDGNTDNPRTVTVTGDKSYSVVCEAQQSQTVYTITATADNGVVLGGGAYAATTNVSLVVTPNSGYTFKQWSDGNTDNPRAITVNGDATYVAECLSNTYAITTTATNGSVSGGGTYAYGETVTLEVTANSGYEFKQWSDGNTDNPRTITVSSDASYSAVCEGETFTVSVTAPNAKVTGTGEYKYGETATLTVIVNNGYNFMGWSDGTTDNPRTVTVTDDVALTAVVETQQSQMLYAVTAYAVNGKATGGGSFALGETVTLEVTPDEGYIFKAWTDGNTDNPRTVTVEGSANYVTICEEQEVDSYIVTASVTNGVGIGANTYKSGSTAVLAVIPSSGYKFVSWSDGNTDNPRYVEVTADKEYSAVCVDVNIVEYTLTLESEHGTVTGAGTYIAGYQVQIEAVADEHYVFSKWSDNSIDNPRLLTIDTDITLRALYTVKQHSIKTVSNNGTVEGGGTYDYGTTLTLKALANSGFVFVGWSDGVTESERTIVVEGDMTYTALFEEVTYTLTVEGANGTCFGSGDYPAGTSVEISAVADSGYKFVMWSDGNTDNPRTITTTSANAAYTALFEEVTYILTVEGANGTCFGSGDYPAGTSVEISAVAGSGYKFVMWSDGNTDNPRTITTTSANTTYTAIFEGVTYALTVEGANGTCFGSGDYPAGTSVEISAVAGSGYKFVMWSDGNTDNPRTITTTSANATYTALFEDVTYTLTVEGANGTCFGSGDYPAGTSVEISAVAGSGYKFVMWSDGNTDNPRTITTTSANTTYTALFEEVTYMLTVYAEHGEVEGGNMSYTAGAEVTLTAVPDEGYLFEMWEDGCADPQRVVTVDADMYLTAYFEKDIVTDIEEVTSGDVVVRVRGNNIEVEGADRYAVYNLSGSKIADTTNLPRGIYLVVVGESTRKVLIK